MHILGKPEDLMPAIAQLSTHMRYFPTNFEEQVNTAIDAKHPEAIKGCTTVIQENILQSMALEVDGRIAERTAHFAIQDALAFVDRRVAAVQAELASFQNQVAPPATSRYERHKSAMTMAMTTKERSSVILPRGRIKKSVRSRPVN